MKSKKAKEGIFSPEWLKFKEYARTKYTCEYLDWVLAGEKGPEPVMPDYLGKEMTAELKQSKLAVQLLNFAFGPMRAKLAAMPKAQREGMKKLPAKELLKMLMED